MKVFAWTGWLIALGLAGVLYTYASGLDQLENGPHFHSRKSQGRK